MPATEPDTTTTAFGGSGARVTNSCAARSGSHGVSSGGGGAGSGLAGSAGADSTAVTIASEAVWGIDNQVGPNPVTAMTELRRSARGERFRWRATAAGPPESPGRAGGWRQPVGGAAEFDRGRGMGEQS